MIGDVFELELELEFAEVGSVALKTSTGFLERFFPLCMCLSQYLESAYASFEHLHFFPSVLLHLPGSGSIFLPSPIWKQFHPTARNPQNLSKHIQSFNHYRTEKQRELTVRREELWRERGRVQAASFDREEEIRRNGYSRNHVLVNQSLVLKLLPLRWSKRKPHASPSSTTTHHLKPQKYEKTNPTLFKAKCNSDRFRRK